MSSDEHTSDGMSDTSFESAMAAQLTKGPNRINVPDWAGGLPEEMATLPQIRIGTRWYKFREIATFVLVLGIGLLVAGVFVSRELRTLPGVAAFIAAYPGVGSFGPPVTSGFPWWLRYEHYLNLMLMLLIIRAGLQILAEHPRLTLDGGCKPGTEWFRLRNAVPTGRVWSSTDDSVALPRWLGLPGIRHSIGLARWWHFSMDFFWVINGAVFISLLFATDQWRRLVPVSWDIFPSAVSMTIQYLSLNFPPPSGWEQYNALQQLAYFTTVFIAAPLAIVTGLLQSPAIAAKLRLGSGILNRQISRTIHFGVLLYFLVFIAIHITMVMITGAVKNINHITRGVNAADPSGVALFAVGIAIAAFVWVLATPFTLRYPRVVQRSGRFLIGWLKGLMERWNPTLQYREADISPYFWSNGAIPTSSEYQRLKEGQFRDFKLKVGGLVENPVEIPFDALKAMTKQEQITQHYCIQGWSGIAKWGGVPMRDILTMVRPRPEARFAVFYSFQNGPYPGSGLFYDVHKIESMSHTQTILAYEMNGAPLADLNGAPIRLRDEVELGFKQVKWVQAIEFVESFAGLGSGQGGFDEDYEYYGWRMTI